MKRAEVWRMWPGSWGAIVFPRNLYPERSQRITQRPCLGGLHLAPDFDITFPTHAEALTAALEAVGLTPTNPEKEQNR